MFISDLDLETKGRTTTMTAETATDSDPAAQREADKIAAEAVALYSVSQLARQLGVTARTIRFYEDKHLIAPQRAGTTRVYTHRDRARLMLILRGKRLGFSLREIKEFLDLYDVDPTHHLQLRQLLGGVRKRMGKLHEQRAAIDESLTELTEIERQCEEVLASRKS
jgi:DNA-binding transcriptional MerR regulator